MSSFVALNVEPDEDIEEEIDDTKEIQIEEALKLYQNALKLHSQGPSFYSQAREAYAALFHSEIFKYPESISDYKRATLQDILSQDGGCSDETPADPLGEFDINDSASSALPQTIYLSYKNHGQFVLDSLQERLRMMPNVLGTRDSVADVATCSRSAIGMFAEALARDDTDLDLWRKSARLGSALQSCRIARFCLESVLVGDDDELEVRPEQLGLEEVFAAQDLQKVLQGLCDRLSLIKVSSKRPRNLILGFSNRQVDLYPYLPTLSNNLRSADVKRSSIGVCPIRQVITLPETTWTSFGKAILQFIVDDQQSNSNFGPGTALAICIPAGTKLEFINENSKSLHDEAKVFDPQDIEMSESTNQVELEESGRGIRFREISAAEDQSSSDQRAAAQLKESLEGHPGRPTDGVHHQINPVVEESDPKSTVNPRKRSSMSVGNDEPIDGGRAKSRRIRARESNAENPSQIEDIGFDQTKYYENRLEVFSYADEWMFGTVGALLSKIGVGDLGTIDELKKQLCPTNACSLNDRGESTDISQTRAKGLDAVLAHDLRNTLMNWDDEKSRAAIQGDSSTSLQDLRGMNRSGLAIFLEHSRRPIRKPEKSKILTGGEGLPAFVHRINDEWLHLHEVVLAWLEKLLMPYNGQCSPQGTVSDGLRMSDFESTYTGLLWPEALKETVVQIIIREDEHIYNRMSTYLTELEGQILHHAAMNTPFTYTLSHSSYMEMTQTLYELHLDVYALINNPNSEVDQGTRLLQRDRLARWGYLASTSVNHFIDYSLTGKNQRLHIGLRHLWASTFHSNMVEDASREHILLCLQDLKHILLTLAGPIITLMNNAIMPEISIAAIDQEISRLNSMDFFMKLFGSDTANPVDLIESIEPILEPASVEFVQAPSSGELAEAPAISQLQDMAAFLDHGDATLRLFLWRRLQDAYQAVDYVPKVLSCCLRSLETIMKELRGSSYLETPADHRQAILLRWLKSIDDLLRRILSLVLDQPEKIFECIDMDHLRSSMSAVAQLSKLLHSFALYDDSLRVGQIPPPETRGSLAKSLESFKDKLRDMQVRGWLLQYTLLKEGMLQEKELFETPADDRAHFLRSVHSSLGVRSSCKCANKILLKLTKSELLTLQTQDNYEADICQVLFDLHGLKFSASNGVVDHGCPVEKVDRNTSIMMIDFVLAQANRMSIKDISKSELKSTIDKMQQAIGVVKHPSLTFNRRVLSTYLKSPINPSRLFDAAQGMGDLSMIPMPKESAKIADKGWYFLLGHASLTKFRSQKRVNPVPINDLDEAITYFRQDLEHGTDRWETWYRLAQTFDSKLEEDITWSADKINNNHMDLVGLQRSGIHCYTMAIATAIRTADDTPKTRAMLSDLYTDFGIRMYSSSREPLSMGAFNLSEYTRHFSSGENQQMYKGQPFKQMKEYLVWNFCSYLFRQSLVDKPKYWMNHYMLSKCLWKMFNCDDSARERSRRVEVNEILDALLDAIETLPERKDSRSDPIFEPHFRLVSIIHKLAYKGVIKPAEAGRTLSATPWGRKASPPEDLGTWKPYILEVLKNLKNADKSNWHHRILARAAHVLYDDQEDAAAAAAAKNELTQQTFTKTMTLQVWKPEFERPGRHFVYTTRYVYFFVKLLEQISDRASLDQLLRRVRKKQGDFINHAKLWEDICRIYAKLIRRGGNVPEGYEEGVFKPVSWDEFVSNSARLETWTQLPTSSSPVLDLLREAVELKKLNNNLIKVTMFEDLIADIYAQLYETNVPKFGDQGNGENKERMKVDHLLMASDGPGDAPTPPTSSDAPPPRGRTKGIARRDIQRRAETIVNRSLIPRVTAAKVAVGSAEEEPRQTPLIAPLPIRSDLRDIAEEVTSGAQSSVPGSIHDSADESELSEIDDEGLARLKEDQNSLLFPNLPARKSPNPSSELSGQMTVDGEDGEDGNEAEGEGDDVEDEGENEDEAEGEAVEAEEDGEDEDGEREVVDGEAQGEIEAEDGEDLNEAGDAEDVEDEAEEAEDGEADLERLGETDFSVDVDIEASADGEMSLNRGAAKSEFTEGREKDRV